MIPQRMHLIVFFSLLLHYTLTSVSFLNVGHLGPMTLFFILGQVTSIAALGLLVAQLTRQNIYAISIYYGVCIALLELNRLAQRLTGANLDPKSLVLIFSPQTVLDLNLNFRVLGLITLACVFACALPYGLARAWQTRPLAARTQRIFLSFIALYTLAFYGVIVAAHVQPKLWSDSCDQRAIPVAYLLPKMVGLLPIHQDAQREFDLNTIHTVYRCDVESGLKILQERERRLHQWLSRTPPSTQGHNILMIAVESFRADALTQEKMPETYRHLVSHSAIFTQHYSSGNSTPIGWYSLLSGSSPETWLAANLNHIEPVIWRLLKFFHLQPQAFLGMDMHYMNMQNLLLGNGAVPIHLPEFADGLSHTGYLRDRAVVGSLIESLKKSPHHRADFLWITGTHFPYSFDEQNPHRTPILTRAQTNLLQLSKNDKISIQNRYANALWEIDKTLSALFDQLERDGRLNHTIVIIVGDHGEEFFEPDALGHGSHLNDAQTQTSLWIRSPDFQPQTVNHVTSHSQIIPTLLSLMGHSDISTDLFGNESLLQMSAHPFTLSGPAWSSCGALKRIVGP